MASTRRLPPIQLLEAFAASARHLSFKAAAHELHVTPSAISQQIKALEEAVGLALFERLTRALRLTDAGAQYRDVATETLEAFRRGTEGLWRRFDRRPALRASMIPFVAHEVVIPHLHEFQRAHPRLELVVETSMALADVARGEVDVAIRYGPGVWDGVVSTKIGDVIVTPVCGPELLRRIPLREPADLRAHTLIHIRGQPDYWSLVAQALGFAPTASLSFDSYFATIRAAEQGLGVALGLFPLTTSWVRTGKLVAPLDVRLPSPSAYHVVCRRGDEGRDDVVAFRDWVGARFAALEPL